MCVQKAAVCIRDGNPAIENEIVLRTTTIDRKNMDAVLACEARHRTHLSGMLAHDERTGAGGHDHITVFLDELSDWIDRRREIAARYRELLSDLPGITLPTDEDGHSWNQFVVRVSSCPTGQPICQAKCSPSATSSTHGLPESCCRDWLKQRLQEEGINTIVYYPIPIHRQPAYSHLKLEPGSMPATEKTCSQVLSLPIFPELTELEQQQVVSVLGQVITPTCDVNQPRMVA